MAANKKSQNSEKSKDDRPLERQKNRLSFDFVKTSRERIESLVPVWGSTPTGVLQNLVAFAIEVIDYAIRRHLSPFVPDKLFESLDYYQRLGEEFVYTAYTMNLPEPRVGDTPTWIMDVAQAALQHDSFESTLPQSNFKNVLDKVIIGNALIEYCQHRSIDLDVNPENVQAWLADVISRDRFAVVGRELIKYCESIAIEPPTVDDLQDWYRKNINDPNHSDCHELLEMLLSMENIPDDDELVLLANKFRVRTKQLRTVFQRLKGHTEENKIIDTQSINDK
ncbi:hypothetical protein NIES2101_26845 [Calothrix sp. HK-06]|nr:hypothetical protein NIES2101_26845 [Calothrix sp. HK-06]